METKHFKPSLAINYLKITAAVVLACTLLFSLDKDMHSPSDFLKPNNVLAWFFYFLPTLFISMALFSMFLRKFSDRKSTRLSLLIGIPIGFTLVMAGFLFLRN